MILKSGDFNDLVAFLAGSKHGAFFPIVDVNRITVKIRVIYITKLALLITLIPCSCCILILLSLLLLALSISTTFLTWILLNIFLLIFFFVLLLRLASLFLVFRLSFDSRWINVSCYGLFWTFSEPRSLVSTIYLGKGLLKLFELCWS